MRLNQRLREIERRVLAMEGDTAAQLDEAERRCALHGAKLGIFLVLAQGDFGRGQDEHPEAVLAALPAELAGVLRRRLASLPQDGINPRDEHAAIEAFLPLDAATVRHLDEYAAQGFARWRSADKRIFNQTEEQRV